MTDLDELHRAQVAKDIAREPHGAMKESVPSMVMFEASISGLTRMAPLFATVHGIDLFPILAMAAFVRGTAAVPVLPVLDIQTTGRWIAT